MPSGEQWLLHFPLNAPSHSYHLTLPLILLSSHILSIFNDWTMPLHLCCQPSTDGHGCTQRSPCAATTRQVGEPPWAYPFIFTQPSYFEVLIISLCSFKRPDYISSLIQCAALRVCTLVIPRCTVEAVEYHAISSGLLSRDKGQGQSQSQGQAQGQSGRLKRYPSFVHWLVHTLGVAAAGATGISTTTTGANGGDGVGLDSSSSSSSGSPISPPQLCGDARGAVDREKTRLLRSLAAAGGVWGNQVQIWTSRSHTLDIYPCSYIPSQMYTLTHNPSPLTSLLPHSHVCWGHQVAEVLTGIARRAPLTVSSLLAASLKDEMNDKGAATTAVTATGGGVAVACGTTTNVEDPSLGSTDGPSPDAIHELFGLVAFCGGTLEGRWPPPLRSTVYQFIP